MNSDQRKFLSWDLFSFFLLGTVWNHTAQIHSLVLSLDGPLQVIFKNLGRANDDVVFLHNLCERDFEHRVSADSLHFVRAFQTRQKLLGVVLLDQRNLRRAHGQIWADLQRLKKEKLCASLLLPQTTLTTGLRLAWKPTGKKKKSKKKSRMFFFHVG